MSDVIEISSNEYENALDWGNRHNEEFYNFLPLGEFYSLAVQGGLDTGCDIDQIWPAITQAKSIFDIGAGYGRAINQIIVRGYEGKLACIERCEKNHQFLTSQYSRRVDVIKGDIQTTPIKQTFDLILWLWTGITEFSKNEQLSVLQKIYQLLNKGGKLVFDTMSHTLNNLNALTFNQQTRIVKTRYGIDYCYLPSPEELDSYQQALKFESVNTIDYQSTTGRPRVLHIWSK
jgi:SAM-dependent methyltransferase